MKLKLHLILGSFNFVWFFFSAHVSVQTGLLLIPVCCVFHLLCDVCVDSMTNMIVHGLFVVSVSTCISLSPFFPLFLVFDFFFGICMASWCLMPSASDWEDCCWHIVLSIMNLFLSTFLKCCSGRHLVSCIGS